MKKRCATCRHFTGQPFPSKPGWRRAAGRCGWELPPVTLPDSMTMGHAGKVLSSALYGHRSAVWPDDGETCPCWGAVDGQA